MPTQPPPSPETVESLIDQIRHEARAYRAFPADGRDTQAADGAATDPASPVDGYLAQLWRRSQPRTELPHRLRRFPLTIVPIGRLALWVLNLLTREQRAANLLACDALKGMRATLARRERVARENSILIDYIQAQLQRGPSARNAARPSLGGATAHDPELDRFFVELGDRFRGPPELVTERLRVYLPHIREARGAGPALDLGCGRGEWLTLMREEEIQAVGVDHNRLLLDHCVGQGHKVIDADLAAFVEQSPPDHWQIVTAFHVIEHLGWPAWHVFLRGIHRILRPSGIAVIETPNPGNLFTAANRFHLDPTHRQPVPDLLLEFAAKHAGFVRVDIVPLHPESELAEHSLRNNSTPEAAERLFGARDYAIIARK